MLIAAALLSGCAPGLAARLPAAVTPQPLTLPDGFVATPIVAGLDGPTQMIAGPDGRLWVAQLNGAENAGTGQVLAVDLATGEREVLLDGLRKPTGIAVAAGDLWIAAGADLLRAPIGAGGAVEPPVPVLTDLPTNGRSNGTLTATPHGEILFETSGSRLGNEPAVRSARLWALTPQDPEHPRELASGLKNAYGHTVDAQGRVWTTEIGDDPIDDGRPPDELNLVAPGADFGWLQCAGFQEPVERYGGTAERCAATRPPVALFPPGATPTSVALSPWDADTLLVALWVPGEVVQVRTTPAGDNATGEVELFIAGLRSPQHLLAWLDGSLLVSEFGTGTIYRVEDRRAGH